MSEQITPNVLIVDDIPQNVQVVASLLKDRNYRIAYAMDGKSAIENAQNNHFDLILLDIMMPEMNGFEVCEALKKDPRTAQIPIIFLTAKTDVDSIVKGFDTGGVDYVTKPFNAPELLARVDTHLRLYQTEQELRALNNSKDKFISIVAHELRSPFAGLKGVLEMLSDQFGSMDRDELQHYLSLARHTSASLHELLRSLLSWSSLQRDLLPYHPQTFDLLSAAEEVLYATQQDAAQKQVRVNLDIPEGNFVFADYEMTKTVLRNLVVNAIMFSHPESEIFIGVEQQEGGQICTWVRDHGVGIPSEHQAKLFRLDSQYKSLGTSGETGTGMGLLLCRELVEKNSGEIKLESIPGKGTTVYFTLPQSV